LEDVIETREGVSTYNVVSATNEQVVLKQAGGLALRTKVRPSRSFRLGPPPFRGFPGFPSRPSFGPAAPETITIDRQGKVLLSKPPRHLPFLLGDLETLVIEELPADASPSWQKLRHVVWVEMGGASRPFGPFGPNATAEWPAEAQSDYAVIASQGEAVRIQKTCTSHTAQEGDAPARCKMSGSGEFTFDLKAGLISTMSMKCQVNDTQQNVSLSVPVTLTCRLLTAAELADHQKRQQEARAAAEKENMPKPLEQGQREKLLADLASRDTGRMKAAAERLGKAVVDDDPGPVAKALIPLLGQTDQWVQRAAAKALAIWAAPEAEDALVGASASEDLWVRASAIEALGKFKTEKAAQAVAAQMYRNRGEASKSLKAMGSVAETAAIGCLMDRDGWVRREACQVLAEIGGKASLDILRPFAEGAVYFEQVEAKRAIQLIEGRLAKPARDMGS
jgi:hypothetical protein